MTKIDITLAIATSNNKNSHYNDKNFYEFHFASK